MCPERTRGFTRAREDLGEGTGATRGLKCQGRTRRRGPGLARGVETGAEHEQLFKREVVVGGEVQVEESIISRLVFSKEETVAQMVRNLRAIQETQVQALGREDPLQKGMATPVFLPGEPHGRRTLVDYTLWCCKESDTTEELNT